jgi:chromosome segregation ATPase
MNGFREKNLNLRAQITQYEKEIERKDKAIQTLLDKMSLSQPNSLVTEMSKPKHLVTALKTQIRDNKEDLRIKEEEIKQLRKSLKVTRVQEMEVEIKMFADECTRLKHIIEEIMKQRAATYSAEDLVEFEGKIVQQDLLLAKLRQENADIANAVKGKDEELANWKNIQEKLQKRLSELEDEVKENAKNRVQMSETRKELQKLKDQLSSLKTKSKDKETEMYKARIEELLRREYDLNEKLKQKDKRLQALKANESPSKEQELMNLQSKCKECNAFEL